MSENLKTGLFKFGSGDKSAAIEMDEGMAGEHRHFEPKPYMNPYLAGIGLGFVLLVTYLIMGWGLGASGAFTSLIASVINVVNHDYGISNHFYAKYLTHGNPLKDWLVFEVLGVLAEGFISGTLAGRFKKTIEKGPRSTNSLRLILAFAGGALMGFGAKLARGCTSGQALTGGAVLNLGSWAFMLSVFAGAYMLAYFVRKEWR